MIILETHQPVPHLPYAVVTSGAFDGVHLGHEKILKRIVNIAKDMAGQSVVLTFWPHPRRVLFPEEKTLRLLTTFEEKAERMEAIGIDYVVKIAFTPAFAQLSSEAFVHKILMGKLRTKKLIIGYDHRFGKNRSGSFEYLMQHRSSFGFEVEEIPRQDIEEVGVSSTKIRRALFCGAVDTAAKYMGRNYTISGMVIQGNRIGATLGFPTANIKIEENDKLVPKDGTYAVRAHVKGKIYQAMLNIGVRPTLDGLNKVVEAHLFDFNECIYGACISIDFVAYLREERKFDSLEALKGQLKKDKKAAVQWLSGQ